jgi:Transposase DDE domain.
MTDEGMISIEQNWKTLLSFLPEGWREKANGLNALRRARGFSDAEVLLRVMMIHLASGHSLRVTSALAREGGLASVSDVALFKRLKLSGEWFLWMAQEMRRRWLADLGERTVAEPNLRVVDATLVKEPGATGSTWRIHYAMQLETLSCDEVYVTTEKTGESFERFSVQAGDIFLGDRGYHARAGIFHIVDHGGHVVVRMRSRVNFYDLSAKRFDILKRIKDMSEGEVREYPIAIGKAGRTISCRVCVVKKTKEMAQKSRHAAQNRAKRKGQVLQAETLEFADYVLILTTLPSSYCAESIMEMYRQRWQIELVFKRMKSLLGVGHLRKQDMESSRSWLQGKLFVAMLLETFIRAGEAFFPWGYVTPVAEETKSVA